MSSDGTSSWQNKQSGMSIEHVDDVRRGDEQGIESRIVGACGSTVKTSGGGVVARKDGMHPIDLRGELRYPIRRGCVCDRLGERDAHGGRECIICGVGDMSAVRALEVGELGANVFGGCP